MDDYVLAKKKETHLELREEILKKKYREFIWMFLEKTTHQLIWGLRELGNASEPSYEERLREVNLSTKIVSHNANLDELINNQAISKICKALDNYDKIVVSSIPINESCIIHSKIKGKSLEWMMSKLNPSGIKWRTKIQQEWGGSIWEIEFYTDEERNDLIFCEEIGRFKMKFIFSERGIL